MPTTPPTLLPTREQRNLERAERDRVAAELKRVLDAADRRLNTWAGPCRRCAYCAKDWMGAQYDLCRHPAVQLQNWDNATGAGGGNEWDQRCAKMRANGGLCGPQGVLAQPKLGFAGWLRSLFVRSVE